MNSTQSLPENRRVRNPLNSFDEVNITLIPKPEKTVPKKKEQISLLNTDIKMLNEVLTNRIQQYIKRIIL